MTFDPNEGAIDINDGNWHHIVGVYDGYKRYLYIDGVEDANGTVLTSGAIGDTDKPVMVGSRGQTYEFLNGCIDDVQLYNYALSAGQVTNLFNGTVPSPAPLIRYEFNESSGLWADDTGAYKNWVLYFPLTSTANMSPKVGDEGVYNPVNVDSVNFVDYAVFAQDWLEGPMLWP